MMLFYLALSIEWQILMKFITWFVDLINQINCKVLDTSIFAMKIIIFVCFGLCFWIGPIGWGIRVIYVLTWTMQVREVSCFGSEVGGIICVPCRISRAQDRWTCASADSGSLILSGCGRSLECMCWQHSLTAFKLGQSGTSSSSKTYTAGFILYCFSK